MAKDSLEGFQKMRPRPTTKNDSMNIHITVDAHKSLKLQAVNLGYSLTDVAVGYIALAWSEGIGADDLAKSYLCNPAKGDTTIVAVDLPYTLLAWVSGYSEGKGYPASIIAGALLRYGMERYSNIDLTRAIDTLHDIDGQMTRSRRAEPSARRTSTREITLRGDFVRKATVDYTHK